MKTVISVLILVSLILSWNNGIVSAQGIPLDDFVQVSDLEFGIYAPNGDSVEVIEEMIPDWCHLPESIDLVVIKSRINKEGVIPYGYYWTTQGIFVVRENMTVRVHDSSIRRAYLICGMESIVNADASVDLNVFDDDPLDLVGSLLISEDNFGYEVVAYTSEPSLSLCTEGYSLVNISNDIAQLHESLEGNIWVINTGTGAFSNVGDDEYAYMVCFKQLTLADLRWSVPPANFFSTAKGVLLPIVGVTPTVSSYAEAVAFCNQYQDSHLISVQLFDIYKDWIFENTNLNVNHDFLLVEIYTQSGNRFNLSGYKTISESGSYRDFGISENRQFGYNVYPICVR